MNTYIKAIVTIVLCGLCVTAMAADTFIIKYKLNEDQKAFLSDRSDTGAKKAKAQIREEQMKKLSYEQLDALSRTAEVQVTDLYPLANGAHVITLSKDLDEAQTKRFIRSVTQHDDIEFIEEEEAQQIS